MSYILKSKIPHELILNINSYIYDTKETILKYLEIWKHKMKMIQLHLLCKYYNNPYQLYNIFNNNTLNKIPCYYCDYYNRKSKNKHCLNECLSLTRNIMKYN